MARPRSTAGSVPKPAISHSTLNNIWSSYFQKSLEARGRRLSPVPGVPRLYHSPLVSAAMWGLTELSRQVMIEIPGPAPCVVCGSQWSTGVRSTIVSCILLSLRCTPASSVLPKSVQGRIWISTIERSMLGKGHFSVAFVQMPSNISRTCPTTLRWSTKAYIQL